MAGQRRVRSARVLRSLAARLPAGVRARALRRLGPRLGVSGAEHGLVTVVVLVEDVDAPRVADCLRALRAQRHAALEVVVTPVAAAAVDLAVVEHDPRFHLGRSETTWQAAADAGAAAARGDYVGFVRGCDWLTPHAVAVLVESLAVSGSDLATGRLVRPGPGDAWLTRAQRRTHAEPAVGVDPADRPDLAADLVVGNKLFRRAWWVERAPAFADDDDWLESTTVAAALAAARSVDIVDSDIVTYAPDHGRRPFAALPSPLPGLDAWVARADRIAETVRGTALAPGWETARLEVGSTRFLLDTERADDATWRRLVEHVRAAEERGLPDDLGPAARSLLWLAARDDRGAVERLAEEVTDLGDDLRTVVESGQLLATWTTVDVPAAQRRLPEAETPLRTLVRRVAHDGDGLVVDVFTRVPHLDLATHPPVIEAERDGAPVTVIPRRDVTADRWAQDRFASAADGSVRLRVPGPGVLRITLTAAGVVRSADVRIEAPPTADDVGAQVVDDLVLAAESAADIAVVPPVAGLTLTGPRGSRPARLDGLPTAPYRLTAPGGLGVTAGLRQRLPLERLLDAHRVQVTGAEAGALTLLVGPPYADDELGAYAQQRLREEYAGWARAGTSPGLDSGSPSGSPGSTSEGGGPSPAPSLVDPGPSPVEPGERQRVGVETSATRPASGGWPVFYFESYAGRSATDSPRAICEELLRRRPQTTAYWGISDHGQSVPEGATPLLIRSRAWWRTLATADCLVTNTELEEWFVKRPGQLVVQTFHGYPSKGMGAMQWASWELPPARERAMRRRGVDTWDLICTPTPEMTRHYREQYGYAGEAIEHGYPRNDALRGPGADGRRQQVRALLDLDPEQTAVLYAPTWRDHLAIRPRAAAMPEFLDVAAAARELGEGHVLLLRGHRFHTPPGTPQQRGAARIVDVTDHPEINDLILASDVAVLDYSSLRFDYALTGNPMVFLVPDLDDYDGGVRGFLFPFTDSAPGPLVTTTAEVVAQVRDVAALRQRWAEELAAFDATYNPWQDGQASARAVDEILARLQR